MNKIFTKNFTNLIFLFFSITAGAAQEIKTEFINDRYYVLLPFLGVEAKLLLDSGGATGIYPEFAWYWKTSDSSMKYNHLWFGKSSPFIKFPEDILQKKSIRILSSQDEEVSMMRKILNDGILGHGWLGNRTWRFNYLEKKLFLLDDVKPLSGNKIDLHFKNKQLFYPRIKIEIDGNLLDVLLDTGATSFYSETAIKKLELTDAFSASSFIRDSVFTKWKKTHPDWKIIEMGDRMGNSDLIQVPILSIAGYEVGPIWFARRTDKGYDVLMSQYMDCKCDGAIGGNVLKFFDIIMDYKNQKAYFNKP